MKKTILLLILFPLLAVFLTACGRTDVPKNADATLTFIYHEENISIKLSPEESAKVIDILNGNAYDPVFTGIPSCGFDKNISLKIANRIYAIACDECNYVQDMGNLRYFSLSSKEMAEIRSLFESYGGYFPCV